MLGIAVPNVFVTDFQEALEYYTGVLGFEVVFTYGEPAYYGHVRRDAAVLALRHVDQPAIDPAVTARDELLSAYIEVEGVDEVLRGMPGAVLHAGMREEPWGMRAFIVRDPCGNLVYFGGR